VKPSTPQNAPTTLAAVCAVALIAQQVGSKAVRDALFLSNFAVTALPFMVMGAAAFSIVMVMAAARAMRRFGPAWVVPRALLGSAVLLVGEWALTTTSPRIASVLVYLHVASLGSLLISGFWSVVNETFDPRSAKVHIGRIAAAAALGGVIGGVLAARVAIWFAVPWVLPLLAVLQVMAAIALWSVRPPASGREKAASEPDEAGTSVRSTLQRAPYLRNLGVVVFLATLGAALFDYVFKARASAAYVTDEELLRFFAFFHTAVGVSTFVVQSIASRIPMDHLGLSARVATNPIALGLGGACALIAPSVAATGFLRGAHTVLNNSLFRSGYEAMFSPVSPRDKRGTKQLLDVGFERAGDAAGGGVVRLLLMLPVQFAVTAILLAAVAAALLALGVARRLRARYVGELEQRLMSGVFRIEPSDMDDPLARTMMMGSMSSIAIPALERPAAASESSDTATGDGASAATGGEADALVRHIQDLRSGEPGRVLAALQDSTGPDLAPHVIPLLAWDTMYPHAAKTLIGSLDRLEGQLVDRLLDRDEEFSIRRRIPAILTRSSSRMVIEGLMQALLDARFEVRFRAGRALSRIHARDPGVAIDRNRVFAIVLRETRVDRGVWESQRLLDQLEDSEEELVDAYLRKRTNRSLEHVFTLLSLALDKRPLTVAFQGLQTDDPMLRGTALEYLESALPADIRDSLWPFLEDRRAERTTRKRADILDSLLSSHASIQINLEQLRERMAQQRDRDTNASEEP
jgi:ATP/ADP translocase